MSMLRFFFVFQMVFLFSNPFLAQKDDPVLFTVGDLQVPVSEFRYIYTKTNGQKADFSKSSLQEYLDLYTNFKLKVKKAKDLRLDTISTLKQELNGYRRQLADSYLIDREVTEKLVEEAYQRTKQDVDISHIMIMVGENASPADTLKAWNRVMEAKQKLEKGEAFAEVAVAYSDDKSVSKNQGRIGFVTALFPNGFHNLEKAAYEAPLNKVVGPVRTNAGYHLLMVHERRPARGEIEVAHILIRLDKYPDLIKARFAIDSLYNALKAGANFEELAQQVSHDKFTAHKGGYLGFFGINRYEKSFEDAAFALQNDGDFSPPVQTSIGWHIIRRISLKRDEPYAAVKARLQNQIKQDARFEQAKKSMIERIKREGQFSENLTTLRTFTDSLLADTAATFLTYKWKAPTVPSRELLFSFGKDMKVTLGDFAEYAQRSSRLRQQLAGSGVEAVVSRLYEDFVAENAMKFEERQLETKYPEFKSLMREYEEGVLLFEVTNMEVWNKASADTAGLQAFYEKNKNRYQWQERVLVSQYTLPERAASRIEEVREFAKNNKPDAVLARFNKDDDVILSRQERNFERGRNETIDKMTWKPGEISPVEINRRDKSSTFFKIEAVLPPDTKTLNEARGYVLSDYQDFLEKKWLEELKGQYKVRVNEKAFNSLIKR